MAQTPQQARPFSPLLTQQLPGGSEILDRNLLAIRDAIGNVVQQFNRTVTFIGVGGGSSSIVNSLTALPPIFVSASTGAVQISEQGAIVSGSTSTSPQNLGALATGVLQGSVSAGVSTIGAYTARLNNVVFGLASGLLTDSNNLQYVNGCLTIASSDGASNAITLNKAGTQVINKHGGSLFLGPDDANQLTFQTNGIGRLSIDSSGGVTVASLTAGGLVKASATFGQLLIASPVTDYQTPITWPTPATALLISAGASSVPTANANLEYVTGSLVLSDRDSSSNSITLSRSGTQQITKNVAGDLGMGTTTANQLFFYTNGTTRLALSLDATIHGNLTDDTTPTTLASWDSRHAVFGGSGASGGAVGFSRTSGTQTGHVFFARPPAWESATLYANDFTLLSNGTTQALTIDASQTTSMFGAVQINGVTAPSNVNLIIGHTTQSDRDRAQFFLGAGTLGPTGTGDSTLFDLIPTNTSLNSKAVRSPAVYSTLRIRGLTYTGGTIGDAVGLAASLYIDAQPSLTVATGPAYSIYVAAGNAFFGGDVNLATGRGATAPRLNANGVTNAFVADGTGGSAAVGFFGAGGGAGVTQQTGGAASAGATYTATEQGMINRMYSALRTYGLLT